MVTLSMTLNDPLTLISRTCYYSTFNISETIGAYQIGLDTRGYYRPVIEKVMCGLLNCAIASDLDRPARSFQLFFNDNYVSEIYKQSEQ